MLAKKFRLASSREIKKIIQRGKQVKNPYMAIRYGGSFRQVSRCAVIISNKISKKAVVRNKLRRQIKAIFFVSQPKFFGNYDMVIIGRSGIVNMAFQELKLDMEALFRKAKLL